MYTSVIGSVRALMTAASNRRTSLMPELPVLSKQFVELHLARLHVLSHLDTEKDELRI